MSIPYTRLGSNPPPSYKLKKCLYATGALVCTAAAVGVGIGCYFWEISNSDQQLETHSMPSPLPLEEHTTETTAQMLVDTVTQMAANACVALQNTTECVIRNVCDHLIFYRSSEGQAVAGVIRPNSTISCIEPQNLNFTNYP